MEINNRTAIVGGYVRDALLGIPNQDIDLVTEHSLKEGLEEINKIFSVKKIDFHSTFKTATLSIEGWKAPLDLVTARREYYEFPGALPKVLFPATLEEDLRRRDFTVNAVAFEIIGDDLKFLDPFNGYSDLQSGLLRVLYSKSFQDDPTRILRGVRFATRLNFKFEKKTEKLLMREIFDNGFSTISKDRFWQEIFLILDEKNFIDALKILRKYKILNFRKKTEVKLQKAKKYFPFLNRLNLTRKYLLLTLLFDGENSYTSLNLSQKFVSILVWSKGKKREILQRLKKSNSNSEIYSLLEGNSPYLLFHLLIESDVHVRRKIKKYLFFLKNLPVIIDGKTLIKHGFIPNENFKNILKKSFLIQLDMKNPNEEKIIKELKLYE